MHVLSQKQTIKLWVFFPPASFLLVFSIYAPPSPQVGLNKVYPHKAKCSLDSGRYFEPEPS